MKDRPEPPVRRRRLPAGPDGRVEILAAAGLAAAIVLACLAFAWMNANWMSHPLRENSGPDGQSVLSLEQADGIVARGGQIAGQDRAARGWAARLAFGSADAADYLMRVFTSADYLQKKPEDQTFLSDINWVVSGKALDSAGLDKAARRLGELDSRLAYINELAGLSGLPGKISLPAEPARLRTFHLVTGLPPGGSEIVGILPVRSEVRLTGPQALFKIYSDGGFRTSQTVGSSDPAVQNEYETNWDTRLEKPGRHQLSLLVLTSDGRGEWVDIGDYTVPAVTSLATGEALSCELTGDSAWYLLGTDGRKASLIAIGATSPLEMEMFDENRRLVSRTETVSGQTAALRGDFTETAIPDTLYVRIRRLAGAAGGDQAAFWLVTAPAAARPAGEPDRLLGVLDIRDDRLQIRSEDGSVSWQSRSGFLLIDPAARLSRLGLVLPDGNPVLTAPVFDPETVEYGLVVEAATTSLQLDLLAMEGSAAAISVRVSKSGNNGPAVLEAKPDDVLPLSPSRNDLLVGVTGYDGSQRTYTVHILRPPEDGGYDKVLERFPLSYRSPLWLLHIRRPAWRFEAARYDIRWKDFIDAQDQGGLSLVSEGSSPDSWIEPGSPVYDGSTWKAAARPVIEYFADPRNFLDETGVFSFEQLTFLPDVHTVQGIEAIVAGSFMSKDNAAGVDYAGAILEAGEMAGISPFFLASRIIQEMGRDGRSPLSDGTLEGYEGVYNFYNIGSSPDPDIPNGAQINGARFALYGREPDLQEITDDETAWQLPWTTPRKAIIGGAAWIAERYVRIGQDTLYLQKFDLVAPDGLYIHQYAQNIQMAWAEGLRNQKAYAGLDLLDEPFVFKIPVFGEMPEKAALKP